MKWVARIFGFCGHQWEWTPEEALSVEGYDYKRYLQKGTCTRCNKQRYRQVVVE